MGLEGTQVEGTLNDTVIIRHRTGILFIITNRNLDSDTKNFLSAVETEDGFISPVLAHAAKPHNYAWCRYCRQKGKVIRFQLFEIFRIIHPDSFFYWRKETIRTKKLAFDEDTWSYGTI
jgi:hypothetical protein